MLATKTYTNLTKSADLTNGLSIPRTAGVLRHLNIPAELCSTSEYQTASVFDSAASAVNLCKGTAIQALTDSFGIRGNCEVRISFINSTLALVELVDGTVYMRNANDYVFGYDINGNMTKYVNKIHWWSVKEAYDYIMYIVTKRFNISEKDAVDYIYNAEFILSLAYEENPPSKAAQTHCYSDFTYRMKDMSGSLACGLFDFIIFEKEEEEEEIDIYDKWKTRGRKRRVDDDADEQIIEKSDEEVYEELAEQYDAECADEEEEVELDPDDFDEDEFSDWDANYGADDTDGYYDYDE